MLLPCLVCPAMAWASAEADRRGRWCTGLSRGGGRGKEPAWHRRARKRRSDARLATRLANHCLELAGHHGSRPPKLVEQAVANARQGSVVFRGGPGIARGSLRSALLRWGLPRAREVDKADVQRPFTAAGEGALHPLAEVVLPGQSESPPVVEEERASDAPSGRPSSRGQSCVASAVAQAEVSESASSAAGEGAAEHRASEAAVAAEGARERWASEAAVAAKEAAAESRGPGPWADGLVCGVSEEAKVDVEELFATDSNFLGLRDMKHVRLS